MKTRSINTIAAALAITMFALATQVEAGDSLKKLLGKVEKYIDLPHPVCPTPLPYPRPRPYPQPAPLPCPEPAPLPCPEPTPFPYPTPEPEPVSYFLGVYTSTVPVDLPGAGPSDGGPRVYVVPGYGEQVYGQRINQIVPNSPAFHAGLEPGDILVNANGLPMDSDQDLRDAIAGSQGYMEMQVLDSRSGQLVWVVAETDPQNSIPMAVSASSLSAARKVFNTKRSQRTLSTKAKAPSRSTQIRTHSTTRRVSHTGDVVRRPPVRRR
jgi:hypothetical protein